MTMRKHSTQECAMQQLIYPINKKDIELSFERSDQVKISDDLVDFKAITKQSHPLQINLKTRPL